MRKIFTLLCGALFAAQFTSVSAQSTTKMKVYKTDGSVVEYATSEVDSVSFSTTPSSSKENLGGGIYLINGHKFIDLGLPSGILWAEANIGAETAYDDGNYYAWGETAPKSDYSESAYTASGNLLYTKYTPTGKTVLEPEDDAAYVNWGSGCRMPTDSEFSELSNSENCTWEWVSVTNSAGETTNCYKVVSKRNNNVIYLPASGGRSGDRLNYHGSDGYYWSSTLRANDISNAYILYFNSGSHGVDYYYRYYGRSVRPVAEL